MALYEWVVHVLERVSVLDVVRHMSTRSLEFRSRDKLWMFCCYGGHGTKELRNTKSHGKLPKLISCYFRMLVIEKTKIALKREKFVVCNGYK